MICFLLNREDLAGRWLFRSLKTAGRKDIKLIFAEELVYAPTFNCGFQRGKAFFSLVLNDGFVFSDNTVGTVINRINHIPTEHVARFKSEDRDYVLSELSASFVFLFSILPNIVFNKTTPAGFCGRKRSQLEWMKLAKKAGFEIDPLLFQNKKFEDSGRVNDKNPCSVLYFKNKCYEIERERNPLINESVQMLGELSGENILEVWFNRENEKLHFLKVSTQPSFRQIGNDFIEDLNKLL
jgi:hypothetical protein